MSPEALWTHVTTTTTRIREETGRVIIGQHNVVDEMLASLLSNGHCLLTGVPGLAKTLLVSTLGKILGLRFRRIQFTPDLMPADIVGSDILQTGDGGQRSFQFVPGPIFSHLILADEINRTPPKTQAALLEAMQEKQVTVSGQTRPLEEPFLVFATQNPIEHEGTYPLPEAQLDRFFFNIRIDYPTLAEEEQVLRQTTGRSQPAATPVLDPAGVIALQQAAADIPVPDHVFAAVLRLVHATRPNTPAADDYVSNYVAWGAGPRASQCLIRAAKSFALLRGHTAATLADVARAARPVLRHRIIPNYNATGEGITVEQIVAHLLPKLDA